MRILKFIVNGQKITRDPKSDFSGLVPGSKEELIADFSFSSEWDNALKVAAFYDVNGECPPQQLIDGMYCIIPKEATKGHWFRVQILGNKNGTPLITNKIDVIQNGGRV